MPTAVSSDPAQNSPALCAVAFVLGSPLLLLLNPSHWGQHSRTPWLCCRTSCTDVWGPPWVLPPGRTW